MSASRGVVELAAGRVIAAATETFFGLLADASNPAAIDAVLRLKRRDAQKGISLLLPQREAWSQVASAIPDPAARLADRFWPGPLTIAVAARSDLDPRLVVDGTVAVRWPGPSEGAALARAFGRPLTATSANSSGTPPLARAEDVEAAFADDVAAGRLWVVPGRAPGGAPSTLVRVDEDGVRVLRQGAVSEEALQAVVPLVRVC